MSLSYPEVKPTSSFLETREICGTFINNWICASVGLQSLGLKQYDAASTVLALGSPTATGTVLLLQDHQIVGKAKGALHIHIHAYAHAHSHAHHTHTLATLWPIP